MAGPLPIPDGEHVTEKAIEDLATRLAALSPDDALQVHRAVAGLHAERARAEEERIAGLRAISDEQAVYHAVVKAAGAHVTMDIAVAVGLIRDAGFVRGVTVEAAYRAGYSRAVYDGGGTLEIPDEDDADYIAGRGYDLDAVVKGA